MSQKRKLTSYTIEQRYKVLTLLDKGEKASKIAKEYGIPKNNISTWNKPENREKIVKEYEAGAVDSKRKRFREGKYSDIEEALLKWFKDVQENFDITTTFEEYVAADNSVSTTESITEEAIVQSVLASKFVKEEADGQEEDEEETEEKDDTPMNTVQCLEAIAGIRRFFQASNLPENVFDALTVLEDYALQQQITRKTKQTKITELFDNMIKKENN